MILQSAFDGLRQIEANTEKAIRSYGTDEAQLKVLMEELRVNLAKTRENIIDQCRRVNGDQLTEGALALTD
jgi:hypothetical protein